MVIIEIYIFIIIMLIIHSNTNSHMCWNKGVQFSLILSGFSSPFLLIVLPLRVIDDD